MTTHRARQVAGATPLSEWRGGGGEASGEAFSGPSRGASVQSALSAPAMSPDGQAARGSLSCGLGLQEASVPIARDFVTRTLDQWGMAELRDAVELVVAELVTNAVQHAVPATAPAGSGAPAHEQPIELKLLRKGPHVMCVVTDASDDIPVRTPLDPLADRGHGLHLVAGHSRRWGWAPLGHGGKAVWALFYPPRASSSHSAR